MNARHRFTFATGLLGAGVIAPGALVGGTIDFPISGIWLLALLLACGFLGGTVGVHAVLTELEVDRPQGNRRWLFVFALPVAYLFATAGFLFVAGFDRLVFLSGIIGGVVAFVGAIGMFLHAEDAYATRATEESDVVVELGSQTDAPLGVWGQQLGVATLVFVLAFAGYVWARHGDVPTLMLFLGAFGAFSALTQRDRPITLLESGVRIGSTVIPWDDYETFELTDDQLVVHGGHWYRGDVRIDRDQLDDENAVVAVLERHLPREL